MDRSSVLAISNLLNKKLNFNIINGGLVNSPYLKPKELLPEELCQIYNSDNTIHVPSPNNLSLPNNLSF